jgi:hypothetical protein
LIVTPYGTLAILKVTQRNYNKTLEYISDKYANTEYKHIQAQRKKIKKGFRTIQTLFPLAEKVFLQEIYYLLDIPLL